jgi:hypothetical protein
MGRDPLPFGKQRRALADRMDRRRELLWTPVLEAVNDLERASK